MEAVFAEIRQSEHPLMPNYMIFSADDYGMYIEYYSPSKPLIHGEHQQSKEFVPQLFWVEDDSNYAELQSRYMRMIRFGKPNYWNYSWIAVDEYYNELKHLPRNALSVITDVTFQNHVTLPTY